VRKIMAILVLLVFLGASILSGMVLVGHSCTECSDGYYSMCPAHVKQSELVRNILLTFGITTIPLAALSLWWMCFGKIIYAGYVMSPISLKVRMNN